VGAVMNGGVYHPLTLLKRPEGAPVPGRRVIKPETSQLMLGLMRDNVTMEHGSGRKADALGLRVGGKTGSAQKAGPHGYDNSKNVSSFAAVFPTDGPVDGRRYLVLILFDEPHATPKTFGFITAGWNAAPVAGRVIDRIAPFLHVNRVVAPAAALPGKPAAQPVDDEAPTGPI
jgi:cell division protein FtsI (penicillin-binding protein 3)